MERDYALRGIQLCQALGFDPVVMPNATGMHGYFAGTDDERVEELNTELRDRSNDAVW
jgi:muramoyltetrapeptide carboxypeptidase LdcA involved in peptidoglycan recycling